jgi:transmembrane sensor
MSANSLRSLLELFLENNITREQLSELSERMQDADADEELRLIFLNEWRRRFPLQSMPEEMSDRIVANILAQKTIERAHITTSKSIIGSFAMRIAIAASLLLFISLLGYKLLSPLKDATGVAKRPLPTHPVNTDIQPGGNKATLTLGNGATIVLDSAHQGLLAKQGNVEITKSADDQLSYAIKGDGINEVMMNMVSVPVGGQYELVLPDKSKVWLNSSSSIQFPVAFKGHERQVFITGEVYFEVSKDVARPFVVAVNDRMKIKVLGTHFNVNAYSDEVDVKTTLLEGSINLTNQNGTKTLIAGEQARSRSDGGILISKGVNTDAVVAWKNGYFQFNQTDLPGVLRQAARWYGLVVKYEGKIPDDQFTGRIPRTVTLSRLLKWMEWSEIKFRLEGKTLTILD